MALKILTIANVQIMIAKVESKEEFSFFPRNLTLNRLANIFLHKISHIFDELFRKFNKL